MTTWVLCAVSAAVVAVAMWPRPGRRPRSPRSVPAGPARWRALWSARPQRHDRDAWVAEFAELAALALEAGLPPGPAAALALDAAYPSDGRGTAGDPLREALAQAGATGSSVGEALRHAASGPGPGPAPTAEPLAFLGAAWSLTDDLGAPAAGAARACATVLRDRAAAEAHRRVVSAGPRASMWLLTALPLGGPLVGVLLGMPVGTLYGRPAAAASAAVGVALTAVGWAWARAILRRSGMARRLR